MNLCVYFLTLFVWGIESVPVADYSGLEDTASLYDATLFYSDDPDGTPRSLSFPFHWPGSDTENKDLKFRLYLRGSSVDEPTETCAGSCENITFEKLSTEKPIKILIHGWRGHEKCVLFQELVKAFLDNTDYNIITVDWRAFGSMAKMYNHARERVPEVAKLVGRFLNSLRDQRGIRLEDVHILGHSLGAHIAGMAGYHLDSPGSIGRITGLDPAGPMFSKVAVRERLSNDSAIFVDVIHTTSRFLGFGDPIGHVDFYPNGPRRLQPGCGFDIFGRCSHRRSYYFYAESIARPNAFLAIPCTDWRHYGQESACHLEQVVPMGENTPSRSRGVYYLTTNKQPPFGKGTVGQ